MITHISYELNRPLAMGSLNEISRGSTEHTAVYPPLYSHYKSACGHYGLWSAAKEGLKLFKTIFQRGRCYAFWASLVAAVGRWHVFFFFLEVVSRLVSGGDARKRISAVSRPTAGRRVPPPLSSFVYDIRIYIRARTNCSLRDRNRKKTLCYVCNKKKK